MTPKARAILIECEGLRQYAYDDGAGYLTIGVGHKLTPSESHSGKLKIGDAFVDYRTGLTNGQCNELLEQDIMPATRAVVHSVHVALTENQRDALAIFAFNVGECAFKASTLVRLLNEGKYDQVPEQLRRWIYAAGRIMKGLQHRREEEIKLWNSEDATGSSPS